MQRQTMRVDFDLKTQVKAPFRYKQGEVDQNGIEFELVNVDLVGLSGAVYALTPSESKLEPQSLVITGNKAVYIPPTNEAGDYKLELVMYNTNGKTKSADVVMTVIESISASIADYETLYEQVTRKEAEFTANENTRKTNENTRIANENARKSAETNRVASMTDIEKRFASLSTAQQQQAEVADARMDTHGTVHANLKTRLDEDFKELASKIPTDVAMNGYESVTTNDTLSGDVKNTTLTGQTLVNVFDNDLLAKTSFTFDADGFFKKTQENIQFDIVLNPKNLIKPATTYTFIVETKNNSLDAPVVFVPSDDCQFNTISDTVIVPVGFNGTKIIKITSVTDLSNRTKCFWLAKGTGAGNCSFRVNLLEGDHTDKPLEFFEGLKSSELETVTSHGVNLVDWVSQSATSCVFSPDGWVSNAYVSDSGTFRRFLVNLKKGQKYRYVADVIGGNHSNSGYIIAYEKPSASGETLRIAPNSTFTIPEWIDNGTVNTYFYGCNPVKEMTVKNASIYEVTGSEPSTYVPYTSSKTTLSESITLRSLPNGVADTYDVDTGVLTRRCGEVVLNGSENWEVASGWNGDASSGFVFSLKTIMHVSTTNLYCDKFQVANIVESAGKNVELIYSGSTDRVFIKILNSKLPTPDVAGFKAWLSANPTTVVYQLATPTTEYIENNGQLRSYDYQTTVYAESVVPVKLSGNIPVNYASTLAKTMQSLDELQAENRELRNTIDELSNNVNQIHAFMYRMMSAETLEEPELD